MAVGTDLPNPWWSEELLRRAYVQQGLTKATIARRWGCSTDTITRWIEKHGLEERGRR